MGLGDKMDDILDYNNIDKFDFDGHINNYIDNQIDFYPENEYIQSDFYPENEYIQSDTEEKSIENLTEEKLEDDSIKEEEEKIEENLEEGGENEDISEILRDIIRDGNDSDNVLRDYTISVNNIVDTPINDYSITEGYLFLIFIVMFIGFLVFIISKGVPKWR